MKHFFTLCLLAVTLCAFAQTKKTVAVLEPIDREQTIPKHYLNIVRITMETAITISNEYEAFDRSALDRIKQEQAYQQSGEVDDADIKKLGQMAGAAYVLIAEVTPYNGGKLMILANLVNVESGEYENSTPPITSAMDDASMAEACKKIAQILLNVPRESSSSSSSSSSSEEENTVFVKAEKDPEFPGGLQALFKYLSDNIKYPVEAKDNGIQGQVVCQFTVNKDGSIVDNVVIRSSGEPSLDSEAIRVINSMPKWKPGEQRGKPVRVKFTLPVRFRLQ